MILELIFIGSLMWRAERTGNDKADWWVKARLMLKQDEGVRHFPYQDTEGNWTIGVGRNLTANPLSIKTIRMMLDEDIEKAIVGACNIFGQQLFDSWSDARQHAITNLVFNLGESGFRQFHRTIAAIKENRWDLAAQYLMESKWARQVKGRAHRIVELVRNETYQGYVDI